MKKEIALRRILALWMTAIAFSGCGSDAASETAVNPSLEPLNPLASFIADSEMVSEATRLNGRPAQECVVLLLKEVGEAMRRSGGMNVSSTLDSKLRLSIAQTCSVSER